MDQQSTHLIRRRTHYGELPQTALLCELPVSPIPRHLPTANLCQLILLTISIHKSSSPTLPTLATVNQQFLIPSPLQPPNLCVELISTSYFDTPDPETTPMSIAQCKSPPHTNTPTPSINQKEPVSINCVEGEGISSVRWNEYIIFQHMAGELYSTNNEILTDFDRARQTPSIDLQITQDCSTHVKLVPTHHR
jgi:hypothetical protein